MLISLVVPCFNEQDVVPRFHEQVHMATAGLGHDIEFVYVDDGSSDRTAALLQRLAAQDARVRYVSFSRNFGKEAAMLAGLRHASGDTVVILDADLQHPPELIGRMVELYEQGHDQVIARRTRDGDRVVRTLAARLYYRLVNRMVDVEIVDGVGDFRLLSRRAVDALLHLPEYHRFSKGLFAWVGFPSVTFTYRNAAREGGGGSRWSFGRLFNYGIDGLLSFTNKPLRAAVWTGLGLVALAGVYAVWIVAAALTNGVTTPGYVTLVVVVTGLSGAQMMMLGVVGEYIGRIYHEVKRRPHYVVRATNTTATTTMTGHPPARGGAVSGAHPPKNPAPPHGVTVTGAAR